MSLVAWRASAARIPGMVWVLAGQALLSLTSFATVAAVGRWAGAEALGVFALGLSCYFLAISVADTLIATPYTYLHAQENADAHRELALAGALGALLVAGIVVVPLAVLWWLDWTVLARLWPALPCVVALTVLREFVRRHLLVTHRYGALFVTDAVLAVLQIAGLAGLIAWGQLSAFSAMVVVGLAAGGSLAVAVARRLPSAAAVRRALARLPAFLHDALGYGAWLFLGGLCHVGSVQLYPWLAMANGGARQAGIYAACVTVVNLVNPLLVGLTNYFRPRFMQALRHPVSGRVLGAYVIRRSPLFVLPALALAIGASLFGDDVLVLFYGERFRDGGAALAWMGWGTFAVAVAAPVQLALLALHAPATNLTYHGFSLVMLAVAAWLGWGALDAARLGQLYGVINLLGALLLSVLLWRRGRSQAV